MNSNTPVQRSKSGMHYVPSFNDFCSGVSDDMEMNAPAALKVPGSNMPNNLNRSWSIDSDDTPRSAGSNSFVQTFSRALYEHMRTN